MLMDGFTKGVCLGLDCFGDGQLLRLLAVQEGWVNVEVERVNVEVGMGYLDYRVAVGDQFSLCTRQREMGHLKAVFLTKLILETSFDVSSLFTNFFLRA
jgi:hypothetical protein